MLGSFTSQIEEPALHTFGHVGRRRKGRDIQQLHKTVAAIQIDGDGGIEVWTHEEVISGRDGVDVAIVQERDQFVSAADHLRACRRHWSDEGTRTF